MLGSGKVQKAAEEEEKKAVEVAQHRAWVWSVDHGRTIPAGRAAGSRDARPVENVVDVEAERDAREIAEQEKRRETEKKYRVSYTAVDRRLPGF